MTLRVTGLQNGLNAKGGAAGDFGGLRGYQRSDSPRQIAWGATARTGQLVARERTVAPDRCWCLELDEVAFHDPSAASFESFELAIRALASLAAGCVKVRQPIRVTFDGCRRDVRNGTALERMMDDLARLPRRPRSVARLPSSNEATSAIVLTSAVARPSGGGLLLRFADVASADTGCIASDRQLVERLAVLGITVGNIHAN